MAPKVPPKSKRPTEVSSDEMQDSNASGVNRLGVSIPPGVQLVSFSFNREDRANSTLLPGQLQQPGINIDEPPSSILKVQNKEGVQTRSESARLRSISECPEDFAITPRGASRNLQHLLQEPTQASTPSLGEQILIANLDTTAENIEVQNSRLSFVGGVLPSTSNLDFTSYEFEREDMDQRDQTLPGNEDFPGSDNVGDPDANHRAKEPPEPPEPGEPEKENLLSFTKMLLSKLLELVADGDGPDNFFFSFLYEVSLSDLEFFGIFDPNTQAAIVHHLRHNGRRLNQVWANTFLADHPGDNLVTQDSPGLSALAKLTSRMFSQNYPWSDALQELVAENPGGDYITVLASLRGKVEQMFLAQQSVADVAPGTTIGRTIIETEALNRSPDLTNPASVFEMLMEYHEFTNDRVDQHKVTLAGICSSLTEFNQTRSWVRDKLTSPAYQPTRDPATEAQIATSLTTLRSCLREIFRLLKFLVEDWSTVNSPLADLYNIEVIIISHWCQVLKIPGVNRSVPFLLHVPPASAVSGASKVINIDEAVNVDPSFSESLDLIHNLEATWKNAKNVTMSTSTFSGRRRPQRSNNGLGPGPPPRVVPPRTTPELRPNGGQPPPAQQQSSQPPPAQQQSRPPAPPRQPPGGSTQSRPDSNSANRNNADRNNGENNLFSRLVDALNNYEANHNGPDSGSGRYRSNQEAAEDQITFDKAVTALEDVNSRLETATIGQLDVFKFHLRYHVDRLNLLDSKNVVIPTFHFREMDLDIKEHALIMTSMVIDKANSLRQEEKRQAELEKQQIQKYRNEIPKVKFPALTAQENWLIWRQMVENFINKVSPPDNDVGVFSMVYDSLSSQNKLCVSTVNPSIDNLRYKFEVKYQKNVVHCMIMKNIGSLSVPKGPGKDQTSHDNITRILENIVLITQYGREGDITLAHLSLIESVSFTPFQAEQWSEYLVVKEQALNSPDGDFANLDSSLADATMTGQSILDSLCAAGTNAVARPARASDFKTLSPHERLLLYVGFAKKVQYKLNNGMSEDGASDKPAKTGGASAHLNTFSEAVYLNTGKSVAPTTRRAPKAPPPARPMRPCPLRSQGCSHETVLGSAFSCLVFIKLDKTRRAACVKNDNLCVLCLQPAHGKGTQCLYKEIRCKHCHTSGLHNRRSGLCPDEPPQEEGHSVQLNLEESLDDDLPGAEQAQYNDMGIDEDLIKQLEGEEEFQESNLHICDASEVSTNIVENIEEFQPSMVRPNPYMSPTDPDVPLDKIGGIKKAIDCLMTSCIEASKSGVTRHQTKERPPASETLEDLQSVHCAYMMSAVDSSDQEDTELAMAVRKSNLNPGDLQDMIFTQGTNLAGFIHHGSRQLGEVQHLRVGPQSEGDKKEMFDKIHRTAVSLHKFSSKVIMQQVTVAVLIENVNAFPGDISNIVDTHIIRENNQRFLIIDALLDTGASLVLVAHHVLTDLQPARTSRLRQNINTGNGVVPVNDFYYEICLKTSGASSSSFIKVLGGPMKTPINAQPGLSAATQKIIKEEFRIPDNMVEKFTLRPTTRRPHLLIGLNCWQCLPKYVSPLSLGCRPALFSPNLNIFTVDVAYGKESQYFVSGNIGTDPDLFSHQYNTPGYFLQEKNLTTSSLLAAQTFNPHLLQDLREGTNPDNEAVHLAMTNVTQSSTRRPDPRGPPLRPLLDTALLHISEMSEQITSSPLQDEASLYLAQTTEEDASNVNLLQAKEVEKFIESESAIFIPLPVCPAHQKIWSTVVEKCTDCLRSADPDSVRKQALADEIKKNLFVVPHPENKGKPESEHTYTMVQRHVNTVPIGLAGHLSVSNFPSALRSSEKLVKKLKGTPGLANLAQQNRTYLEQDKFRVLSEGQVYDIAEGITDAMFFHRNLVYKVGLQVVESNFVSFCLSQPDSVSTAVRMIVDTSWKVRGTPYTLANNNPSPKGFTPSLSETLTRFCFHENYVGLDISKACKSVPSMPSLTLIISILDHSVRLHPSNFMVRLHFPPRPQREVKSFNFKAFCSLWFNEVEKHGTRDPYIVHSTMTGTHCTTMSQSCLTIVFSLLDFGMGAAHMSLSGSVEVAGSHCSLEDSFWHLMRNLFVDNIGLALAILAELFRTMGDIVSTLKRFGLLIDKFYIPHRYLPEALKVFPHLTTPDSTVVFGLIWFLETDNVLPRIKLFWHGSFRGKPVGLPLEETDVHAEKLSRRVFARLMASFYDLLGRYLGVAVAQIKLRCKKLILATPGVHLDADVADTDPVLDKELKTFWECFKGIQTDLLPHPRSVLQPGFALQYVTVCHDASPRMIGSVMHVFSDDTEGNRVSAILGSKSALNTGTVPRFVKPRPHQPLICLSSYRNEKLSLVQATDILLSVVSSLSHEWKDNQVCYILGDRSVPHCCLVNLSHSLSLSTIASYLFQGELYTGDGLSRATFIRVTAALNVISKILPKIVVKFCWIENKLNTCSDLLTKEIPAGQILKILNSATWRGGDPVLMKPRLLEKFMFYEWRNSAGTYTPLPDYLKKATSYEAAMLLHLACEAPDNSPEATVLLHQTEAAPDLSTFSHLEKLPPPPQDDILFFLYSKPHAVRTFINNTARATDKEAETVLFNAMLMTRSGLDTDKLDNSVFVPSDISSVLVPSTLTKGTWNKKSKTWSSGIRTTKETRAVEKFVVKVKSDYRPPYGPLTTVKLVEPGVKVTVPRLSEDCYKSKSFLHHYQGEITLLPLYGDVHYYLDLLNRKEMFHAVLNIEAAVFHTVLKWRRSKHAPHSLLPAEQIWINIWVKIIRSDQYFFPPKGGTKHEGLQIIFNKLVVQDDGASKHIANMTVPLLSNSSPLFAKLLLSCHKHHLEITRASTQQPHESEVHRRTVHCSTSRTLVVLTTGFFSVTCPNLKACCTLILGSCPGCRRHREQFFKVRMSPRYVRTEVDRGAWTRCSFDEVGPALASDRPGGRKNIQYYFFLFTCLDTKAICCVPAYKIGGNALQQAVQAFIWKTGATPAVLYCDQYSTHLATENVGQTKIIANVSHAQHRNFVENRVKEVKKMLRAISNNQRVEPLHLGSLTILDLIFLFDGISYAINSTPICNESPLSPAQIIWPGTVNSMMSEHLEDEVFSDLGSARNASRVDRLLREYRDIIFTERSKNILGLQKQFEDGVKDHPVKKGARSHAEAEVGDIVMIDYKDNKKLRLAKIISLNENKTTAEVLVNGKSKYQAVNTLRVLSIYRQPK